MNEPLTINPNRIELDEAYLQMAEIWAKRSKANRLQVGAIMVKDRQIISDGYNGMPAGTSPEEEVCEEWDYPEVDDGKDNEIGGPPPDKVVRTKHLVLHAEANAILKIAKNAGVSSDGATLYQTHSPCPECAKLIIQAGVKRVVYRNEYRIRLGIECLEKHGISCVHLAAKKGEE